VRPSEPAGSPTAPYQVPAARHRIELVQRRSRFIATAQRAATVPEARAFIGEVRSEFPDATHNVYAFRVGYGSTEICGASDDGEPSGTAGRPTLSVVRGGDIGDVCVVITRYFGGTKLGTGGLVRAYTAATQRVLSEIRTELRREHVDCECRVPYPLYELVTRALERHEGETNDTAFGTDVGLKVRVPLDRLADLEASLAELSAGSVTLRRTEQTSGPA